MQDGGVRLRCVMLHCVARGMVDGWMNALGGSCLWLILAIFSDSTRRDVRIVSLLSIPG